MASADFSSPLREEISPGKMQNLSPRAAWLYLMRLDDLRALLFKASLPPAPGLAASSCPYGRGFASRFFRLRLATTPCASATVAVIGSDWLLSSNKTLPMLGTPCRRASARRWSLYISEARRAKHPSPRREPCGIARENASPGTGRKAVLSPRGRAYRIRCHASLGMTGIPLGTTLGGGALVAPRCSRPHQPLGRRSR